MTGVLPAQGQYDRSPRVDAVAAEQCVIGAIVQSRRALDEVSLILKGPNDFYRPVHGLIYQAALELRGNGGVIEPMLLAATMPADVLEKVGGAPYLHTCIASLPTIANAAFYARIVRKAAALRQTREHGIRSVQLADQFALDNADEAVALVQQSAAELTVGGTSSNLTGWSDLTAKVFTEIERIEEEAKSGKLPGITSGFSDVDRLTGGWRPGQLIVIAGRPAMGKSTCGLNFVQNAARLQGKRGLVFSAEMDENEVGMRLLSAGARIPFQVLKTGGMTDQDWTKAARYVGDTESMDILVDPTPNVSWAHIENVMHQLEAEDRKPDIVAVDYLGLMTPPDTRKPRREQVDDLTRMGKLFSKRWHVSTLLLAQLSRANELRTDKRPQLSDLRESGSIENDADIVMFVHRDDYYDKESPRAGEADFIFAKHRGGPTDTVTVAAQLHLSRFVDMAIV